MEDIIRELQEIASNAGDNMDRQGEYISDNLYAVIEKLKAMVDNQ